MKKSNSSKKKTTPLSLLDKFLQLLDKHAVACFLILLAVGMYLRFFNIETVFSFGWDQSRDSFVARDLLQGKWTLVGPRTGIGQFHLGPLYYYMLAPFFWLTNLDPMGSNYFNMIMNIVNFVILFMVTRKIFNNYAALFVVSVYTFSNYLIEINRVPWNVTLMPGIAALIFYGILQIYKQHYRWVFIIVTLAGLYFHVHFTAVFLPLIILLSLILVKEKRKVLTYLVISIPLYLVWFIPNIMYAIQTQNSDLNRFQTFLHDYSTGGIYGRFLLHRIPDTFILFDRILLYEPLKALALIIPALFAVSILFFEKDRQKKLFGYLVSVWFFVPLIGFTLYGGPMTEYYLLYTAPLILYIAYYLQEKLLQTKLKYIILVVLLCFWGVYIYQNAKNQWIKTHKGGLAGQKEDVRKKIQRHEKIFFNEGDIKAYLYELWVKE